MPTEAAAYRAPGHALATVLATTVATVALLTFSRPARADASVAPLAYSYEVENAPPAGHVLVVWPRACAATGEPLGDVDLTLNPDWASRKNDVDYEVIVKGKTHVLPGSCVKTSRLYALPVDAFPLGSRDATADDVGIGQAEAGAPFAIVPALDAVDRKQRIGLFATDPRVARTELRFDAGGRAGVIAVHEVLAVDAVAAGALTVHRLRVVYTYVDGGVETAGMGASADASAEAGASAEADASADAGAGAESGKHDIGTRWVFLAAVGGLVAGALLAYSRKKRSLIP